MSSLFSAAVHIYRSESPQEGIDSAQDVLRSCHAINAVGGKVAEIMHVAFPQAQIGMLQKTS